MGVQVNRVDTDSMTLAAVKNDREYSISAIPVDKIYFIWDEVKDYLEDVVNVSHGDVTLSSIRNGLVKGQSQLIVISKGTDIVCATTVEVQTLDSGKRILMAPVIGGEGVDEWGEDFLSILKQMAKEYLCDEVRGAGRKGWERKWKDQGVEAIMTVYKLEVN